MKRKGLLLADDGDVYMGSHGAVIGDTGIQNQYLILIADKGVFKQYPTLGVAINEMIGDDDALSWDYTIRSEMEADGIGVERVELDLSTGRLTIMAK